MSQSNDFLTFRKILTPVIIQIIFWIGVVLCVVGGIIGIVYGAVENESVVLLYSLLVVVLGPLAVRIYCEMLIVMFRINDTLTDIYNKMDNKQQ